MAAAMAAAGGGAGTSQTRPAPPLGVAEYFLPANLTLSEAARGSAALAADARPAGLLYRPALLAQAAVHVVRREYDLAATVRRAAIVPSPDPNGLIDWERQAAEPVEPRDLDPRPAPEARFAALAGGLSDGRALKALERDFEEWVYRSTTVKVRAVPELKVFAGPDVSDEAFAGRVEKAIGAVREDEAEKVAAQLDRKIKAAESKLAREERDLRAAEDEHARRKRNELATHAETLFGLLTKRRRSVSPSFSKRSMTERARDAVAESKEEIEELQEEIEELQEEKEEALEDLALRWEEVADTVETVEVKPYKKDVAVELFGVAWAPYYVVEAGGREVELAAYAAGR
jgi:hypothetical protein